MAAGMKRDELKKKRRDLIADLIKEVNELAGH